MNYDLGFADWELRCHWSRRLIEVREGMRGSGSDDLVEGLDAFLAAIIQIDNRAFDGPIWLALDLSDWMPKLDAEVIGDKLLLHGLHRRHGVVVIARRVFLIIGDIHSWEAAEIFVGASCHRREEGDKIVVEEELGQEESIAVMLNSLRLRLLTRPANTRREELDAKGKHRIAQRHGER